MGLATKDHVLIAITVLLALLAQHAAAKTHYLHWEVDQKNYTRNCATVNITTVNGMYPGPRVDIWEGDTVVVKVTNKGRYNVTIHWHGIRQFLSNWADGPSGITQCPLTTGESYTYEFTVNDQRGTFWWHAHIAWLRATVHGAFIVHPKKSPFNVPRHQEIPIILGTWFSTDPNVVEQGIVNKFPPTADASPKAIANTINGKTGPLNGCNGTDAIETFKLVYGKTYHLRLINAAMNSIFFFKIAGHNVTVVGADGNYLKPFSTDTVVIEPGQTTDVLLVANQKIGKYYFGVSSSAYSGKGAPPPLIPGLGVFEYLYSNGIPLVPIFPPYLFSKDSSQLEAYYSQLRNLNPPNLSPTVDKSFYYVAGISQGLCIPAENCSLKFAGSINNVTFDAPVSTSLLQAYYYNISGVYTADFPKQPPVIQDFSGTNNNYLIASRGTRVQPLNFGDDVLLVLQDINILLADSHPFHLHGHDFYVLGRSVGNYDPTKDPASFNLVDPPKYNTISYPEGGWVAIRFKADNPGVWLMHCHYEAHIAWGMETVFITSNGNGWGETLSGPKYPLPPC